MFTQAGTILWAQLRILRNYYPRGNMLRMAVTIGMAVVWYGLWFVGAIAVAVLLAQTRDLDQLSLALSRGLMLILLYWQLIPVLMLSTGATLDLKRLLAYPIPMRQLFGLEVLLRLSTGGEMLLMLTGASVGLLANPVIPLWAPLGFVPFAIMNLFLSTGIRNLLARLLEKKYTREIGVLLLILAASAPQLWRLFGRHASVSEIFSSPPNPIWPWNAAAQVAHGESALAPWLVLVFWTVVAFGFGRWQFARGLCFDSSEVNAAVSRIDRKESRLEGFFRLPSRLLADPLGAVVEKEVRFLSRAPRFRTVFVMGFTFAVLIWLPFAMRGAPSWNSAFANNYLTFVSVYALLLLGEATFWNCFGFDRAAAQLYFLAPVPMWKTLFGKNIAAAIFIFLEVSAVAIVCALLRMPVSAPKLVESYSVAFVMTLFMLAAGNFGSIYFPRSLDPKTSWRSGTGGRFQAMLLVVYPVISIPVALAFLARYALGSNLAFYIALAFAGGLGVVVYWIALASSITAIEKRREKLCATLAENEGPVTS